MYLKQDRRFILPSSVSDLPSNEITSEDDFDTYGTSITNYCLGCLNSSGKNLVDIQSSLRIIRNTSFLAASFAKNSYTNTCHGMYMIPKDNTIGTSIDVSELNGKSWAISFFVGFSSFTGIKGTGKGTLMSICNGSNRLSLELENDGNLVFYSDMNSSPEKPFTSLDIGTTYGIVISFKTYSAITTRNIEVFIYNCNDPTKFSQVYKTQLDYDEYFSSANPTRVGICYAITKEGTGGYNDSHLNGLIQSLVVFGNLGVTNYDFASYILKTRPLYYQSSGWLGAILYSSVTMTGQSTPKFELSNIIANEPNIGEYLKIKYVGQVARHTSGKVMDLTSSNSGTALEVSSAYCDIACTKSNYLYFKISDTTELYADSGLSTPYDSISISLEHNDDLSTKPYEIPREHKGTLVISGKTIDSAAREGNDVPEIYIDGKLAFSKKCIVTVNPNSNYTNGGSLLKLYLLKYADGTAVNSTHQIYCFPAKFAVLGTNSVDTKNTFTAYYGETWRICKASDESAYLDFKITEDTTIRGTSKEGGGSIIDPCGSTGLRSSTICKVGNTGITTCISDNTGVSTTCSSVNNKNYITPGT